VSSTRTAHGSFLLLELRAGLVDASILVCARNAIAAACTLTMKLRRWLCEQWRRQERRLLWRARHGHAALDSLDRSFIFPLLRLLASFVLRYISHGCQIPSKDAPCSLTPSHISTSLHHHRGQTIANPPIEPRSSYLRCLFQHQSPTSNLPPLPAQLHQHNPRAGHTRGISCQYIKGEVPLRTIRKSHDSGTGLIAPKLSCKRWLLKLQHLASSGHSTFCMSIAVAARASLSLPSSGTMSSRSICPLRLEIGVGPKQRGNAVWLQQPGSEVQTGSYTRTTSSLITQQISSNVGSAPPFPSYDDLSFLPRPNRISALSPGYPSPLHFHLHSQSPTPATHISAPSVTSRNWTSSPCIPFSPYLHFSAGFSSTVCRFVLRRPYDVPSSPLEFERTPLIPP
jgi:hypothetical protein